MNRFLSKMLGYVNAILAVITITFTIIASLVFYNDIAYQIGGLKSFGLTLLVLVISFVVITILFGGTATLIRIADSLDKPIKRKRKK